MKNKLIIDFEVSDKNDLFKNVDVDLQYSIKQEISIHTLTLLLEKVFDAICDDNLGIKNKDGLGND